MIKTRHDTKTTLVIFALLLIAVSLVTANIAAASSLGTTAYAAKKRHTSNSGNSSSNNVPPPPPTTKETPTSPSNGPTTETPPPSVDCKTNPSDPSCSSPKSPTPSVDCTKNPEDPSCKTPSLRQLNTCPDGSKPVDGKCPPTTCPDGSKPDANGKCVCPTGSSLVDGKCQPTPCIPTKDKVCPPCPDGSKLIDGKCVCSDGSSPINGKCPPIPRCPPGFKVHNGICEKTIIRNIIIHEQQQTKPNTLIQLDSEQVCRELGDQACISSLHNFKLLFIHAFKDSEGNWVVNGEVQNISPKTISQLQVIVHFYDSDGNIVGLTQGFTTPSKLLSMQTATFNIKQSPSEQTGTPKYFRISYDFVS